MKKFFAEFKEFAMRGNVMDMAVGVIIGTAFGKITTSLVNDVFMPLIGLLIGGVDLGQLNIVLKPEVLDEAGKVVTGPGPGPRRRGQAGALRRTAAGKEQGHEPHGHHRSP